MKQDILYLSALLPLLAAGEPQWGPSGGQGNGNSGGSAFSAFPSCASSCQQQDIDYSSYSSLCANRDALNTLNTCVDDSDCSNDEKSDVKKSIAQLCANAGSTIAVAPFATYSATSGGSAWPSNWPTDSAWAGATSPWNGGDGSAPGWHGGGYGPFGQGGGPGGLGGPGGPGGMDGSGWGAGAWASSGAWTDGPWTEWWGTNGCPPSTWTGWTDGPWGSSAPWTTWTACTAETTATSVYTTTVTVDGKPTQTIGTSYGYGRVVQATRDASATSPDAITGTDSGAMQTKFAVAGSAAGIFGILAGAILL